MGFRFLRVSLFFILSLLIAIPSWAQEDPNPDSPTPVLQSNPDGVRVRAIYTDGWRGRKPTFSQTVFQPSSRTRVTIFLDSLALADGEGASAIRVYLKQQSGKIFEIKTDAVERVGKTTTHSVNIRLFDPFGYRGQPAADGDSLIYVTWRGLMSNALRIGLGSTGGSIEIPKPLSFANGLMVDGPTNDAVGYRYAGDRIRFLEQAAFGPSPELDSRVRRIGLRVWLAEQFESPYPTLPIPDIPQMPFNAPINCQRTTNPTCFRERYTLTPLQQWFFKEAMYGTAQLRHRSAWALSQIWVTSGTAVQQSSHAIAFHKILMNNAFGNYRDLMSEATLSPTMGHYLDMVRSTRLNPNENYPREILQLFSIGLYMLNQDGTLQLDSSNQPIPTYTQETVNDLSKVFTGWTFCNNGCPNSALEIVNYRDPMILAPANHDTTGKMLLSYPNAPHANIPACANCTSNAATTAYATESFNNALDNIFNHPNVGPFIGKLMIQHIVTSDPSPAYVGRVAAAFNNNGSGVRGDMKAVIKAILLDPEARGNIKTAPRYGKLREPVQLISNLTRIFPARDFNGESLSDGALASHTAAMGQDPFYSPTVFNYFSPDFVVPGSTILAPEFEILNTGMAVKRTNFLHTLIFDGITANASDSLRGTSLDYSELLPLAQADPTGNQLVDALNFRMMHGAMTEEQKQTILPAVLAVAETSPLTRVKTAVYLIAASSQYQIQR